MRTLRRTESCFKSRIFNDDAKIIKKPSTPWNMINKRKRGQPKEPVVLIAFIQPNFGSFIFQGVTYDKLNLALDQAKAKNFTMYKMGAKSKKNILIK